MVGASDVEALQSIAIPRFENRTLPTPHTVFAVLITLPVRSWTVFRRYSEFVTLHQSFVSRAKLPPAQLPPKNSARRTYRAITGLGGLLPQGETGREAEDEMMRERKAGLERYLRAIVASTDAFWRESDEFRAFIELPAIGQSKGKLMLDGSRSGQRPSGRYVPGPYAAPSPARENMTPSPNPSGPITRTLGGQQKAIRESEATRALDDRGLMNSQQAQMDAQDRQLDGLAAILRRQKAMGLAINQELSEQSDLLDDLDSHVDRTQSKMQSAERQMDKL